MTRRKSNDKAIEGLTLFISLILSMLMKLIHRATCFIYDYITFFTSDYSRTSGEKFFKIYFDKGLYGEFTLYRKLIRVFGKKMVLTNLYLDNVKTETTEIDVLAISTKGIYVFEMKNYSGFIYGSENDKTWTQVLNKRTKNKFYNPLRQNFAHIKAIENYLSLDSSKVVPVVVFSNGSKLSKINVGKNQHVFQYREALKFVRKNERTSQELLSDTQVTNCLTKLLEKCNRDDEVKEKHINEVKELILAKSE